MIDWRGINLWNKNFGIDVVENMIVYTVFYLITVVIVDYAVRDLSASPSEAGLAAGIFIIAGLVGRMLAGKWIASVGMKKMLYIGLVIFLVATLLYFGVENLFMLYIVRFLHGLGFGISSTSTGTIVAKIIPKGRYGTGIGYYALSVTGATALGPFLGIYLYQNGNFDLILILCSILLFFNCIMAVILKVPEMELTEEQMREIKKYSLNSFFEKKAFSISFIGAFMGLCYAGIVSFISSYAREIGLADVGSLYFVVYAVCILLSRPFVGKLFDDKNENFVMYPSFIFFAAGLFLLGIMDNRWLFLLAGVFVGLGYGNFTPVGQAIAVKKAPSHHVGLATATFFAIFDAGMGIGPFILGFVVSQTGFRGLYMVSAAIIIVCMILYYFWHGRYIKN